MLASGQKHLFFALAVAFSMIPGSSFADAEPKPPCGTSQHASYPRYGQLGGPPVVGTWHNITLRLGKNCPSRLNGPAELVIVLTGRFIHTGTLENLATRIGAISAMEKLKYWSVTDGKWRTLISEAFAVDNAESLSPRSDFTADEILGGRTLFMAQRDTRSTGLNYYALTVATHDRDHLSVSFVNLTDIRFLLATLFKKRTLISSYFLTRLSGNEWGYYSMTVVRDRAVKGGEKSLINRAAAYLRFVFGQQSDKNLPIAR